MKKNSILFLITTFMLISSQEPSLAIKKDSPKTKQIKQVDNNHYFTSNGIEVILKKETTNNIVGFKLFIKGGTRNLNDKNAGIEKFLLQSISQGSKEFPKDKMNLELSKIGAEISVNSFFDYSTINLKTINKYFDKSFNIFQTLIKTPLLDEKEIELQKGKTENAIKHEMDDPDEYVWKLVNKSFFKDHPYNNDFDGNLDTVKNINKQSLMNYMKDNFIGSKMLIVVTGNFDNNIKSKIEKAFSHIKKGNYIYQPAPKLVSEKSVVNLENRDIPTAYISGRFVVPSLRDKDYPATYLALRILSEKLHDTIRTKRGLSYAVSAGASLRDSNSGYIYVTTTKPKESISLMFEEIEKMKKNLVTKKELEGVINLYYTEYFIKMETVLDRADKLGVSQIMTNDYNNGYKILDDFKKITPEQIKNAIEKYVKNIHFGIIYKKELIDEKDFLKS